MGWVVDARPRPLCPPEKDNRYPLYRTPDGIQGRSESVRKISPLPGFDPRTVHHVASLYTDWAIDNNVRNRFLLVYHINSWKFYLNRLFCRVWGQDLLVCTRVHLAWVYSSSSTSDVICVEGRNRSSLPQQVSNRCPPAAFPLTWPLTYLTTGRG